MKLWRTGNPACPDRQDCLSSTLLLFVLIATPAFAGSQATGPHAAVATSNRFATQVGLDALRRGGNAADASVAVTFALSVAEPQSAGIGGGGTLVYYDAKSDAVWTLDFRENAPAGLTGKGPRVGAAAAGVPSVVAGMNALHGRFGSLKWKDLLAPATSGAKDDLVKTLQQIAATPRVFYEGPLASHIVDETRKAGGVLSLHDLSEYKASWRAPIQIAAGEYSISSVAPPSAGGMMLAEMLAIAGGADLTPKDAASIHRFAEIERRAAFDRDRFFADVSPVSYAEVMSEDHAKQVRASIDPQRATPTMTLGSPAKAIAQSVHTTHFTIVDASGNIAAVTVSLDDANGSGFVVPGSGFVLNDAAKNATKGGDRLASSMTPAIVFRNRKPMLALGSSGGAMTPAIVLQIILGVTRSKMTLSDAMDAARFDQQASPEDVTYERGRTPADVVSRLTAMGHGVRPLDSIGEVNAVLIEPAQLTAISDSRGKGVAGAM